MLLGSLDGEVSLTSGLADRTGGIAALQLGQGGHRSIGTRGRANVGDDLQRRFAGQGIEGGGFRSASPSMELALNRLQQPLNGGFADLDQHRGDFFDALLGLGIVAFGIRCRPQSLYQYTQTILAGAGEGRIDDGQGEGGLHAQGMIRILQKFDQVRGRRASCWANLSQCRHRRDADSALLGLEQLPQFRNGILARTAQAGPANARRVSSS